MSLFDSDAFNRALFFPQPITSPCPTGAQDVFVEVPGARLHVRCYAPTGDATILFFHGNGEVVADYDDLAPVFAREVGVALAVMDFRGYGQSTGEPTLRASIADAHPVLARIAAINRPLIVMGRSLGGALAAELCQVERPSVRAYVFESSAADLGGVVERRGVREEPTEEDRKTFDPLPKLARCTTPALVIHGEDDTLIDPREAEQTHGALKDARLVRIPGRGHNDVSNHPLYWRALRELVALRAR